MRLLAADLSSFSSSLAFFQDGVVVNEVTWPAGAGRHQEFFTRLREGLERVGWKLSSLTALVAGRGPGNFSGMRANMAGFQGLALPLGIPLRSVSSGRAIASSAFTACPDAASVAVVGDARRDALWCGRFHRADGGYPPAVTYERLPIAEAAARLADCPLVASPDATRLAALLPDLRWHRPDLAPSAGILAAIAAAEITDGLPGEPMEPIYIHPPVLGMV